ncbi:MAG: type II secretion system F family protein [Verrucomicrobium sp.]
MAAYYFEALNSAGQRSTGLLDAQDRSEAVRKLIRRGMQPTEVREAPREASVVAPSQKNSRESGARPVATTTSDSKLVLSGPLIIQFTEELCDLLGAGLQLEPALQSLESRNKSAIQELATRLRERVRDGIPFSVALRQTCPSFDELYCNLVAAGEAGGSLPSILRRQARYLNQMAALRSKVTSALIYPAFIIASGIALGLVFSGYLLPKLTVLIKNTHGELPKIAQWMMSLNQFMKQWWWLVIAVLVLTVAAVKVIFKDPARLKWWHRMKLRLPVVGPVLRTRFEVQFLETLGNLLSNGLPLHRGLALARNVTSSLFLQERLGLVEASVSEGASLSRALERADVARPEVVDMVKVGEATGDMADALEKAAERFDRQLGKGIEQATALIQPVIMIFMALMVGSMAWMMISVVYGTMDQMRNH